MVETDVPPSSDRVPIPLGAVPPAELVIRLGGDPERELIIEARRELDLSTLPSLRSALLAATAGTTGRVVVDLSAVDFIDCSSLRPLRAAARSLRREGRALVLRRPSRQVRNLLDLTGVADELPLESPPPGARAGR